MFILFLPLPVYILFRLLLRRHDDRGLSRATGRDPVGAGALRGLWSDSGGRHHRGGGPNRRREQRPEHAGGALPGVGARRLLLPQADHVPTELVHPHGVQPISFHSLCPSLLLFKH